MSMSMVEVYGCFLLFPFLLFRVPAMHELLLVVGATMGLGLIHCMYSIWWVLYFTPT